MNHLHASIANPFSCYSFWIKKTATHKASSTCFRFTREYTPRVFVNNALSRAEDVTQSPRTLFTRSIFLELRNEFFKLLFFYSCFYPLPPFSSLEYYASFTSSLLPPTSPSSSLSFSRAFFACFTFSSSLSSFPLHHFHFFYSSCVFSSTSFSCQFGIALRLLYLF